MKFASVSDVSIQSVLKIKRFLYLPLFSILLIVVLTFVVVIPNIRQLFTLRKEVLEAEETFEKVTNKREALESLDSTTLDEQLELVGEVLPSRQAYLEWILTLNGIAQNNNVTLEGFGFTPGSIASSSGLPEIGEDSVSSGRIERDSQLEKISMGFVIKGNIEILESFFADIESALPMMRIGKISLEGSSVVEPIEANVFIALFYAPLPSTLGIVSRPVSKLSEFDIELLSEISFLTSYKETLDNEIPVGRENIFAPF